MARQEDNNSVLDFIFKTPKRLEFWKLYRFYFDFILRLLYRVIIFDGIPETVSETFFKLILFTQGKVCFLKGEVIEETGSELLALNCSRADTPNVYYIPRKVLVTNPRLKKQYNLDVDKQCVIVYLSEADKYNISELNGGLYGLIERTAVMLADNDISINIAQKNTRLVNLVAADTQNTYNSIKAVFAKMYNGDPDIVVKSSLVDKLSGVPIQQNQSNHNLIELIEVQQYILAHFYEQIGIQTHDQMKKERLVTAEINDNIELCFLNIDDMLVSVNEGLQRVNDMFGTNISARLNPIIEQQRKQQENADESRESDVPGGNELDGDPNEDPEEVTELAADEEPEPEPEPEPETESQEEEAAPEPEQESGQQEEAAPKDQSDEPQIETDPEEDAEKDLQDIQINIEGDNNTIIIGGDDVGSTDEDELPDVGSDNADGNELE